MFLQTEKIYLKLFDKEHVSWYADLQNDPAVRELARISTPVYEHKIETTINECSPNNMQFEVYTVIGSDFIGICGLNAINWPVRNAWVSILLHKKYCNRGYGTEVLKLLMKYAFDEICLHKLMAGVFEGNIPSHTIIKKCGFKEEGHARDMGFLNGKFIGSTQYGIIENEYWEAKKNGSKT
jgi:RimJ/RimL family protein N-acetyltransferase